MRVVRVKHLEDEGKWVMIRETPTHCYLTEWPFSAKQRTRAIHTFSTRGIGSYRG